MDAAEIRVLPDPAALARAAADEFSRLARESGATRGVFTVALSGGSTPKAIFNLLATDHASGASPLPWDKIQIFFGDERHVPPDHADSNFRMANEHLLSKVPIPAANVHRIEGELDAPTAATRYETKLRHVFHTATSAMPRFDLIMLGMGTDGHTASLFPGSSALDETQSLVCATWVEKFNSHRITFTYPLINAAARVLFVAGGADKTAMLGHVLRGDPSGQTYPAQQIRPVNGQLVWLVDEAAAGML
ncbi:MAG: 6-phosphogluconolactonase [Verrucomicrobia bacterium]|nr:6-phosphogluconolactonase [Verrucomicrobiota bacterium]